MANNPPSHWCQDVVEETNLHNPLAAPSMPPPPTSQQGETMSQYSYQQQPHQQSFYNHQQYNSTHSPHHHYQQYTHDYNGQYRDYYQSDRYNQQPPPTVPLSAHNAHNATHSYPHSQSAQQHNSLPSYQTQTYASAVAQGTNGAYPTPTTGWRVPPPPPPAAVVAQSQAAQATSTKTAETTLRKPSRFSVTPPEVAPTPTTSSAPPAKAAKGTNNSPFPPSLKAYVERAFASCKTEADRKLIETHLKDIIGRVTSDGRMRVHRWDLESIPRVGGSVETQHHASSSTLHSAQYSTTQIPKDEYQPTPVRDIHNQYSSTGETKKRKSRFSLETNWSSSKKAEYNPTPSPQHNKKAKGLGIYGPGAGSGPSPKGDGSVGIYGPASTTSASSRDDAVSKQNRSNRFSKQTKGSKADDSGKYGPGGGNTRGKKKGQKEQRVAVKAEPVLQAPVVPLTEEDLEKMKVIGTCQELEKDYFRLTSAPHPSTVRPEHVLKLALDFVKNKWEREKQTNKEINSYVLSQFKSLRQDLTLQHISNELTVQVYESHARIALEIGDLNEYNQCQTQLKQLYATGLKGSEMEFTAYRILYYLYLQGNKKYQSGSQDLLHILASLSDDTRRHPSVAHALSVRRALLQDNYHRFFALYKDTPDLGNCILDLMAASYRFKTLRVMFKAYKPSIEESFVLQELGFEDEVMGLNFLRAAGCVAVPGSATNANGTLLDTKISVLVAPKDETGLLL